MGNRKLRKHIWVSEIRTTKMLAIDNCESITENGNFQWSKIFGFPKFGHPKYG